MNIFLRELKANYKSLIIWCVSQYLLILVGMVKYSGFSSSGTDVNQIFNSMPEGLKAVFGIGSVDLTKVDGVYTIFFAYFLLLAAIHACMLGAVLISKEERDHSADFLFAKPVTRSRVITAKLLAGLFNIVVFNLVTFVGSVVHVAQYNTSGVSLNGKIAYLMLAMFFFQLTFLAIGIALGANLRTAKGATSAATAIILGTYFLSVGIDMNANLDFLKFFSPFMYFDPKSLMFGGTYTWWALALCALFTAASLVCAYGRFGKRDLAV